MYTHVVPGTVGARRVHAGAPTAELCGVCQCPMRIGQLHSGVMTSTRRYYEGHYLCVLHIIGPDETLRALQEGRLPAYDPAKLIHGCDPSVIDGWDDDAPPLKQGELFDG